MEAKRRRLEKASPPDNGRHSSNGNQPSQCPAISDLHSEDVQIITTSLNKIKKYLVTKEAAKKFFSVGGNFACLVQVLSKSVDRATTADCEWADALRGVLSCIGNICNLSRDACMELKRPQHRFITLATRILESGARTTPTVKAAMLRVVGNLCLHKESAHFVSSHSALVDRVCLMLEEDDNGIRQHSFRLIRFLIAAGFYKVVLLSNGAFQLGRLLRWAAAEGKKEMADTVISALLPLANFSPKHTARQLAGSECAGHLLDAFVSGEGEGRCLALSLAAVSTDMRDRLGELDAISRLVQLTQQEGEGPPDHQKCAFLAAFTQDAWGRAQLRESGGLQVLVERVAHSEDNEEKAAIVNAFRHLVHDTTSLAFLARSQLFMTTLIKHIDEYVRRYGSECQPIARGADDLVEPSSPLLVHLESRHIAKLGRNEIESFHGLRTFGGLSQSPRSLPSPAHSFSLSPPSSSQQSPAHSSSLDSSHVESLLSVATESDESEDRGEQEGGDSSHKEKTILRQILENAIWLLSWQANEDANLTYLTREDLITSLLSVVRGLPCGVSRVSRPLRRLCSSRSSLDTLLDMHVPARLLVSLCAAPCRVNRFARRCTRCEHDSELGSEILRCLATIVDSDFGDSVLTQRLVSGDCNKIIAAAVAKIALIRNRYRLTRRLSRDRPSALSILLDELRPLLASPMKEEEGEEKDSLYEGGPPLSVVVILSLSTLLDSSLLNGVFDVDARWTAPEWKECRLDSSPLSAEGAVDSEDDLVIFEDINGDVLGRIGMEGLCKQSEYFQGMFSHDLLEKRERRRRFTFNAEEENCSREEFALFLHALAGCSPSVCIPVQSTNTCVTLITLADKYLCSGLSSYLLGPHGPAMRLLDGDSLHFFLPLALRLYAHQNLLEACFVTLLRFSSPSLICRALSYIAGDSSIADSFMESLGLFLQKHSSLPLHLPVKDSEEKSLSG